MKTLEEIVDMLTEIRAKDDLVLLNRHQSRKEFCDKYNIKETQFFFLLGLIIRERRDAMLSERERI